MNILRGDKVILLKEMGEFKKVGETFEVANITDTSVVLRNVNTKVAVGVIAIDSFKEYFEKSEKETTYEWTKWQPFRDADGSLIGYYRTNQKRVQVKIPSGVRAESTCYKDDEFNLYFGMKLAYHRCLDKFYEKKLEEIACRIANLTEQYNEMESAKRENKNRIKRLWIELDD